MVDLELLQTPQGILCQMVMLDQPVDEDSQASLIEIAGPIREAFFGGALICEPVANFGCFNVGRLLAFDPVNDGFGTAHGLADVLLAVPFGLEMLPKTLQKLGHALHVHGRGFFQASSNALLSLDLACEHGLRCCFVVAQRNATENAAGVPELAVPFLARFGDASAGGWIFTGVSRLEETRHGIIRSVVGSVDGGSHK